MVFGGDFVLRTEFHLNLSKRVELEMYLRPVIKYDSHGVDFHETLVARQNSVKNFFADIKQMGTQVCY
jgi:hypothetical protein